MESGQKTQEHEKKQETVSAHTGGEWLMRLLQEKKVDFIFGTTGGAMNDIQDAMVVVKPPKWIQGLHEFVTLSAASGYGLASGDVGVAMIDRIVGTLNAAGAGYAAYALSSPIVIIASSNAPGVPIPNELPEYHYFGDQFQPIAQFLKWRTLVTSFDTLPEDLDKAFFLARSEHPGMTYVAVRQDMMASKPERPRASAKEYPVTSPMISDERTAKEVVDYLLACEHGEIMTAKLGRHPAYVDSLVRFAHTFGLGVHEDRSFMNYPSADLLYLELAMGQHPPKLQNETDLVLAVDYGFVPDFTLDDKVGLIHMSSDPLFSHDVPAGGGDYGSTPVRALKRIVCDSGPMLDVLSSLGEKTMGQDDRKKVRERTQRMQELHDGLLSQWRDTAEDHHNRDILDGWSIGRALNAQWSESTVLVNGAITFSPGLSRTIALQAPGTCFGNPSLHLGAVTGMAYGVAMADRHYVDVQDRGGYKIGRMSPSNRAVVCTTGDGDAIFGNINSALWTCKHYGIGVLYVILNNACWGVEWPPIEKSPQQWAKRAHDFEFLDLENPRIDFCAIASSVGVPAIRVEHVDQLDDAIRQGLKAAVSDQPFLLDIWAPKHTGPAQSVVP